MQVNIINTKTFLAISALLTGFNETDLRSTGLVNTYFNTVLANNNNYVLTHFFENVSKIIGNTKAFDVKVASDIATQLMPPTCYGGIARDIIILWYTGNWGNMVVSAHSYKEGLMWRAGHTHPPGAKQPGYGSWSTIPYSAKKEKNMTNGNK